MTIVEIFFWVLLTIVFYTYIGYILILALFSTVRKKEKTTNVDNDYKPQVTLLVAAYNEADLIDQKVQNGLYQNYPAEKIKQLWITDGSTDGSEVILKDYPSITVLHSIQRQGKTAAINRAMKYVETPITILTDANTMLSKEAVSSIVNLFAHPKVGCVAGEKRIQDLERDDAVGSGEGAYWQYESIIKTLESKVGSTLSAAGELYAIRTDLFTEVPSSIILDDFVISTRIAQTGLQVKYCPQAFATEWASISIEEEKKRKIRIAAGAFQILALYPSLFNIFKHPALTLQFISHKVLRWIVIPPAIIVLPILANLLAIYYPDNICYLIVAVISALFFVFVLFGLLARKEQMRTKFLFLPYYLFTMNMAIIRGFYRFLKGSQNVKWDKAKRAN